MPSLAPTPTVDLSRYPSVVQTRRNPRSTTDRYAFIPTTRVLDVMGDFGWQPVQVSEARTRTTRSGYQQHLVRLRHADDLSRRSGEVADILLYNSHDGESSFRLMAGVYRFVCSNGLVVGETVEEHRIPHRGYADESVATAVYGIMQEAPALMDRIQRFKHTELLPLQRDAFASGAMHLRFDSANYAVDPVSLLHCRRREDADDNLWTVFNRVQENILHGGIPIRNRITKQTRRAKRITSVSETIRLNQGLWNLAESVAAWN